MSKYFIFVSSPYRNKDLLKQAENIKLAQKYCNHVMKNGGIPMAPHLYFPNILGNEMEDVRQRGITAGIEWLKKCDMMYVFGNWTEGMKIEIEFARKHRIPMHFFDADGNELR